MFTGVGGFEYGIGLKADCIGVSEIDKYANQVLRYRYPEVKNYGDATKIRTDELPDFDMLCGGFPCQAFSLAGKRRGFKDTRGTMFFEVARILKAKRPKIVLLENVKGLLSHEKGETFATILQTLGELGYRVEWLVLNSKFFGVPQNRERVFIIGSIRGTSRSQVLPFTTGDREITNEDTEVCQCHTARYYKGGNGTHVIQSHSPRSGDPTRGGTGPLRSKEHCFTLDRSPHYSIEDKKIRKLTPIECERLQGFPDNWTKWGIGEKEHKVEMSDTQRYKMMGNAVTTNVISVLAAKLI